MKNLNIAVVNNKATYLQRDGFIVCGNSGYTVTFAFDSEWGAHTMKTARFKWNSEVRDVPFSGNIVAVPKIANATQVEVGVFASDLCTTTPAVVPCLKSILCGSGAPTDPTPDLYAQLIAEINALLIPEQKGIARLGEVTLTASGWKPVGDSENLYSQVVTIDGVTKNTQVDLTPNSNQLEIFYDKDIAFVAENDGGVVTVYCIGQKPENYYTIQVTLTEVLGLAEDIQTIESIATEILTAKADGVLTELFVETSSELSEVITAELATKSNELSAEITEEFTAKSNELSGVITTEIGTAQTALSNELDGKFNTKSTELDEALTTKVSTAQTALSNELDEKFNTKSAELSEVINTKSNALDSAFSTKSAELSSEINAELTAKSNEVSGVITAKVSELDTAFAAKSAELSSEINAELTAKSNELSGVITEEITEARTALSVELDGKFTAKSTELDTALDTKVSAAQTALSSALSSELDGKFTAKSNALDSAFASKSTELDTALAEKVTEARTVLLSEIDGKVSAKATELSTSLSSELDGKFATKSAELDGKTDELNATMTDILLCIDEALAEIINLQNSLI